MGCWWVPRCLSFQDVDKVDRTPFDNRWRMGSPSASLKLWGNKRLGVGLPKRWSPHCQGKDLPPRSGILNTTLGLRSLFLGINAVCESPPSPQHNSFLLRTLVAQLSVPPWKARSLDKLGLTIQNLISPEVSGREVLSLDDSWSPLCGHRVRTELAIDSQPGNSFVPAGEGGCTWPSSSPGSPALPTSVEAWRKT